MNLLEIYDNLESLRCDDIMVLAAANESVSEHAKDILSHYDGSKNVSMVDFVRAFSPLDIKTKAMIEVFEELSEGEDMITSEILISSLGKDSRLLFQENEMLDLVAFLRLADLFDDQGELIGIPKAMLEQLHKVNSKLVELNLDVDLTDHREKEMVHQINSLNKAHQKEKTIMFEAAASVEKERDDLYAELSSLRKQLNSRPRDCDFPTYESLQKGLYEKITLNKSSESDIEFAGFNDAPPTTPAHVDLVYDSDDLTETSEFCDALSLSAEIAACDQKNEHLDVAETTEDALPATPDVKSEAIYTGVNVNSDDGVDGESETVGASPVTSDVESEVIYTGVNVNSDVGFDGESETEGALPVTPDVESEVVYTGMNVNSDDGADNSSNITDRESPVSTPVEVWSAASYNNMPWYFENANRRYAETLLTDQDPGEFIVRKSSQHEGWVVSIAGYHGVFLHYLIQSVKGGFALQFVNNGEMETVAPVCKTLVDLIAHFQMTTINENTPILKKQPDN